MCLAVQECLSLMAAAYREVKGQSALRVEAMILENIYSVSLTYHNLYVYIQCVG